MSQPISVRFALVCILALLIVGFAFSTGYSQPGRPPIPPPQPPGFPGGMPNGGMPGRPGAGGQRVTVWVCSGCGFEVAEQPIKPNIANCPKCGARFGNTAGGMMMNAQDRMKAMQDRMQDSMRPPNMRPPANSLPGNSPPVNFPPANSPPVASPPTFASQPITTPSQPANTPAIPTTTQNDGASFSSPANFPLDSSESSKGGLKTGVVLIGLFIGVVFILGVTGLLIWVSSNSSQQRPKKRRSQSRSQDDDDDDHGQYGRKVDRNSMKERWK
jgi:hypothetical protein